MSCEKKNLVVNYQWRDTFLGPERKEHIVVEMLTLVPKNDCLGKPCVLSRPACSCDLGEQKGKGKGKGKMIAKGKDKLPHIAKRNCDEDEGDLGSWRPPKGSRHLA